MRDDDLRRDVAAELAWDPQVDSDAIEVSAASGQVTLRGIVTSLPLKRAGSRAAARVRGVTRVANELRMQIPDKDRRDNEDLRGDVLEGLMLDTWVPMTVDAQARDGFIILTGTAQWHYQREATVESRTTDLPCVAGATWTAPRDCSGKGCRWRPKPEMSQQPPTTSGRWPPPARSCRPAAVAGCTDTCRAPRMTTASRSSCAPGWETQHASRPQRTAGPSRAHAPHSMSWGTHKDAERQETRIKQRPVPSAKLIQRRSLGDA